MKILFIRGFNTKLTNDFDGYSSIKNVYPHMKYFDYSPDEDLSDVYKRLCKKIKSTKYTHLIGHSMGGGMLMRYMHDHKIKNNVKIILLMPLIYKKQSIKTITAIPIINKIRLPKPLLIPNKNLYGQGNLTNDNFYWLSTSQITSMYNTIMLEPEQIVSTLNRNSNCVLFYASKEAFNEIPESILKQIVNLERIDGLHECFNSVGTSSAFFETLAKYI